MDVYTLYFSSTEDFYYSKSYSCTILTHLVKTLAYLLLTLLDPAVASCSRFIFPLPKTFLCQLTTKTPNTACCVNTRMHKFLGIMFVAFGLVPTNKEVKFKTFPLSALPHGGVKLQRSQKMLDSE